MWLLLTRPLLGSWFATQACALTGNQTGDPLVHSPALNPLGHTSQGLSSLLCHLSPCWARHSFSPSLSQHGVTGQRSHHTSQARAGAEHLPAPHIPTHKMQRKSSVPLPGPPKVSQGHESVRVSLLLLLPEDPLSAVVAGSGRGLLAETGPSGLQCCLP